MTKCKICLCTWNRACSNGCHWASAKEEKEFKTSPLCSNCAEILRRLREYAELARYFRSGALMNAMRRILKPATRAARAGGRS